MVVTKFGKMTFRIVLRACVRGLHHSVSVDSQVIMTRKRTVIYSKELNKLMAGKFCTESHSSLKMSQANHTSDQDSDTESGLLHSDSEGEEVTQPDTVKFLIVGLGNPDRQRTRHSVGMQFVDRVASRLGASWTRETFKKTGGFTTTVELNNNVEIYLLKPRVPMNLNGTSVIKSARFFSVEPENIYLVHDELDKPVGKFQIKDGGSASGHNGVKSVMNSLKSDVMPRLRIGIDRPTNKEEVIEYVLEKFTLDEYRVIRGVIDESIRQLFDHMGAKSGIKLDIASQKYSSQDSNYDSEDELTFRFRKGHKYRDDRRDFRYKSDRRDFQNKRDFKYRDSERGVRYRDESSDFYTRDNRRDLRYRSNGGYGDFENPGFKNSRKGYGYHGYKEDRKDSEQNRRNPVYYSDE